MKRAPRAPAPQLLLDLWPTLRRAPAEPPPPVVPAAPQPTFTELLGFGPPLTEHDPADPWGLAPPGVDVDDLSTVQHPTAYELRTPAPWEAL